MQQQETIRESGDRLVPIEDLQHIFGGNRALRRKFLSNLRRRMKASRRDDKVTPSQKPSHV